MWMHNACKVQLQPSDFFRRVSCPEILSLAMIRSRIQHIRPEDLRAGRSRTWSGEVWYTSTSTLPTESGRTDDECALLSQYPYTPGPSGSKSAKWSYTQIKQTREDKLGWQLVMPMRRSWRQQTRRKHARCGWRMVLAQMCWQAIRDL